MWNVLLLVGVLLCAGCSTTDAARSSRPSPIRATGVGLTLEEAKESAFRQAIENRIGVLVLGDREVQSYKLLKDEILTYSAGYIDDYSMVAQEKTGKKWIATVDVWVSSSKLTGRIISSSTDGKMSGKKASDSFSSFMKQKQQADRLAAKIIDGFPENAVIAKYNRTELKFDGNRNAKVLIYFETSWNRGYLDSLMEVLALIQDGGDAENFAGTFRVAYKKNESDWIPTGERYRFSDVKLFNLFQSQFDDRRVAVRLKMKDGQRVIHEDCWRLPDAYVEKGYGHAVQVLGHRRYESVITLTIPFQSKAQKMLEAASNIALSIQNAERCS
jgi:hypothetical protein